MKKIITMVGTSLFENYKIQQSDTKFNNDYEYLKEKEANEYVDNSMRVIDIKNKINKWLKEINYTPDACAEIKSLVKLKEELGSDLEIHFLKSDTILSKVALEIITQNWDNFNDLRELKYFEKEIKALQVKDKKLFNSGMVNLINEIYKISNGYWDNVVINISAGYKATLPFLTILAQVNKCPLYYIFEDTDALIKIPYIPLGINWQVFKENESFFYELEVKEIKELPSGLALRDEVKSLVEEADNLVSLNPLGINLWEKYKESFDIFMISDEAKKYLEKK